MHYLITDFSVIIFTMPKKLFDIKVARLNPSYTEVERQIINIINKIKYDTRNLKENKQK